MAATTAAMHSRQTFMAGVSIQFTEVILRFLSVLLVTPPMTSHLTSAQSHSSHYRGEDGHMAAADITWKMTRDPNFCLADHSKCYNTGQCCPGFVCSTVEGQTHYSVDHPGLCIKVPDPNKCSTNAECNDGQECITSGRLSYCHAASEAHSEDPYHHEGQPHLMYQPHHRGGLGSACDNSTQCLPFTTDGADRLCCQDVKRGRQGTKRMCDRITQLSLCIHVPDNHHKSAR